MRNTDGWTGTLFCGSVAAVLSSAVLLYCGHRESGRALATHNGPSQWLYGRAAGWRRGLSMRHTFTGFLIHHASSCWWACVHRRLFAGHASRRPLAEHLASGAVTAALASFVDYQVVPRRLQPGFEKHVSRGALFAMYTTFGAGLGVASWLLEWQQPPRR